MKILIIENEFYLAQNISNKLDEVGHECSIATNVKNALEKNEWFDVVLLSTSLPEQNLVQIIQYYKESIILLLVSYISNDTVGYPMKLGANDYIQKPFMIENLIRKIHHFEKFNNYKIMNKTYKEYLNMSFKQVDIPDVSNCKVKFPLLIKTNKNRCADMYVFALAEKLKTSFKFLQPPYTNLKDELKINSNIIIYLTDLQSVKDESKEEVLNLLSDRKTIFATNNLNENLPFKTIDIISKYSDIETDKILTIDEYYKCMITTYQKVFSDTELAKKLGISRKSLWEKRKKYEIARKK